MSHFTPAKDLSLQRCLPCSVLLHRAELPAAAQSRTQQGGGKPDLVGGHQGKLRADKMEERELGSFGLYSNDNQAEFL